MSLINRIGAALAAARAWPSSGKAQTNVPDWPEHWLNFMFQLKNENLRPVDAFLKTPSVNSGVRRLLRDIGQAEVKVWKGRGKAKTEVERTGKQVLEGGNLADLLNYANDLYTGRQLRAQIVGSRILAGDGYMHVQQIGKLPPHELWSLSGHNTRPVPGPKRTITGYEHQPSGQGAWVPIKGGVVIQFSGYNPNDEPVGLSDLHAVEQNYLAEYFAIRWRKDFFNRGAVIPGVWTTDESWGNRPLTDEKVKAWQESIRRRFMSEDARWLPVIVQGIKYAAAGMKLSEMELDKRFAELKLEIGDALGIPRPTEGGDAAGDEAAYWLGPIKDHLDLLADVMTERLCPMFDPEFSIEFSLAHILPVQNARLEQAKTHYLLAGGVAIETRNEARTAMDMPEIDGEGVDDLYEKPLPAPGGFGAEPDTDEGRSDGNDGEKPKPGNKPVKARESVELADRRQKKAGQLDRFTDRLKALVLERLAEQRSQVVRGVKAWVEKRGPQLNGNGNGHTVKLDALDVSHLMPGPDEGDEARFQRALSRILKERGADAIKEVEALADIALEVEFEMTGARTATFIAEQAQRIVSVPDETTRAKLYENLTEAMEAGGSLEQLLDAVHDTFDARRNQALTIARTEALSAYNWASVEGWRQTEVVDRHEWITSRSGLGGRHSEDPDGHYQNLDGQVRAIGEQFDVGAARLYFPGDPGGPAGEICNCVCTTLPVINEAALSERREAIRLRDALSRKRRDGDGVAENRIAHLFGWRG